MGHYENCYEADANAKAEKENEEFEKVIKHRVHALSLEEKKFILVVIKNIDAIKSFTTFLKDLK